MYLEITKILEHVAAPIGAAEAHGMAVGMLCVNDLTTANTWLQEAFGAEHNLSGSERLPLMTLFAQTQELLTAGNFEFELFLPDEEALLLVRVDAIRHWCLGFLAGVGTHYSSNDWSRESTEILKDIVEFTHVDTDVEGEQNEVALVELHEYIRVGVQLLQEELLTAGRGHTRALR